VKTPPSAGYTDLEMEKDGNKNQRRWEELKVSSLLEWKGEK
jgi:hypothetical protein